MRPRLRPIVTPIVNACWYVFKAAVAVALVGAAATGVYMYVHMNDEIRQQVESMLAERYPQMSVRVGGARLIEGRGIAVYDVSLADPSADPGGGPMFVVDELMLVCDAQLTSLMRGVPVVERVEVKHPQVALRRGVGGRWNFESLLPIKPCGGTLPQVVVQNGVLTVSDAVDETAPPLALRDIHITVVPTGPPAPSPASTTTAASGGQSTWPSVRFDGVLSGPQVKRIEVHGTAAGPHAPGTATVVIDQLQINSSLLAWVRTKLPPIVGQTKVDAMLGGKVSLAWDHCSAPPDVQAELALTNGRVVDPLLPAPLTDLTGKIVVAGDELKVQDLRGRCDGATVGMSVNRNGWAVRAPLAMTMWANNAALEDSLYQSMRRFEAAGLRVAGVLCNEWDHYRPAGIVNATLQVSFDGQLWAPAAGLTGRQLSFESDKFPYRVTDGSGSIQFKPASATALPQLDLEITARGGGGGGQPIRIVGQVIDPKPAAAGWAQISAENLEIEERMIAAIPNEKCREVIDELNPSGKFNVTWRIDRPQPGAPPQTSLNLTLTDVRINYERFPYPLRGISGVIEARGNDWTFKNLVSGGRRPVHGSGYLRPFDSGAELSLRLTSEQAPLDAALHDALPPAVQHAWTQLEPRGEIGFTADIFYRTGQTKPNLNIAIQPLPASTQIKPTFFPYLLEGLAGTITYRDGEIQLANMRAKHDRTEIHTNGNGFFWPEGNWQFQLTELTADNVDPRQDLLLALPKQMSRMIDRLRASGSFSLHDGKFEFRKSASEISPLESRWDVGLECHQASLACGVDLKDIFGTVRLMGESDGARASTAGELDLESVTFQGVQFTNVRGPLYVDEQKCLLGKWATDQQRQNERRVTANVYDGGLSANAWATFDNLPEYRGEVHVVGADLKRMVVERFGGAAQYTGKVDANVMLSGRGSALELLQGDGDVHVRDANLYELSLLASLLKMLRTGAADKTMFTHSDIAFRIQGRHIYLDQIDFLGDVVNLYGKGETTFDQQLSLVFSAVVGRHEYQLPFVKNLMREANQQIMQMYVNGTLSEPHVSTEAFPGLAQMFQQIGSDLRNPGAAAEQRQAERRRLATQQQNVQ